MCVCICVCSVCECTVHDNIYLAYKSHERFSREH